jgi:osmotically inducible lipoprotein OsmB
MKTVVLALTTSSMLLLSACAGMNDTEQRVVSGAAIGAGSGAALGAVTGGLSIGAGALIGAAAGAAGGYIVDQTQK